MTRESLIEQLNNNKKRKRLTALKKLKKLEKKDNSLMPKVKAYDTNIHIHSFYSFSPYSPTKAAYMAYKNGLKTMGLIDHDTLSGAIEFLKACDILDRAGTVGFECRVHFDAFNSEKTINNPAQKNNAYITVHGVPKKYIKKTEEFLVALREKRNIRNIKMAAIINENYKADNISIDFENDVLPIAKVKEGGSVTERHLLFILGLKFIEKFGKGNTLVEFLNNKGYMLNEMQKAFLLEKDNPYYEYDLLNVLKGKIKTFYVAATDECVNINELVVFANSIGAITAYPFNSSVSYEDEYLDNLFIQLKNSGINAVAYSPVKITEEQRKKIQNLCRHYELLEINGEDINSPRQKFDNELLLKEEFANLTDASWAVIGHERMANLDIYNGMFTEKALSRSPKLKDRVALYSQIGKSLYQ
jgi:hypothetical protein